MLWVLFACSAAVPFAERPAFRAAQRACRAPFEGRFDEDSFAGHLDPSAALERCDLAMSVLEQACDDDLRRIQLQTFERVQCRYEAGGPAVTARGATLNLAVSDGIEDSLGHTLRAGVLQVEAPIHVLSSSDYDKPFVDAIGAITRHCNNPSPLMVTARDPAEDLDAACLSVVREIRRVCEVNPTEFPEVSPLARAVRQLDCDRDARAREPEVRYDGPLLALRYPSVPGEDLGPVVRPLLEHFSTLGPDPQASDTEAARKRLRQETYERTRAAWGPESAWRVVDGLASSCSVDVRRVKRMGKTGESIEAERQAALEALVEYDTWRGKSPGRPDPLEAEAQLREIRKAGHACRKLRRALDKAVPRYVAALGLPERSTLSELAAYDVPRLHAAFEKVGWGFRAGALSASALEGVERLHGTAMELDGPGRLEISLWMPSADAKDVSVTPLVEHRKAQWAGSPYRVDFDRRILLVADPVGNTPIKEAERFLESFVLAMGDQ